MGGEEDYLVRVLRDYINISNSRMGGKEGWPMRVLRGRKEALS